MKSTAEPARFPAAPTPRVAFPELHALREVRRDLARGGLPPIDKRGPEEHARIAAYRAVEELLHLIERYRRRVERGERARLVEREHPREPGRMVIELIIEVDP